MAKESFRIKDGGLMNAKGILIFVIFTLLLCSGCTGNSADGYENSGAAENGSMCFDDYNESTAEDGLMVVPEGVRSEAWSGDAAEEYLGFDIREYASLPEGLAWRDEVQASVDSKTGEVYRAVVYAADDSGNSNKSIYIWINPRSDFITSIGLMSQDMRLNSEINGVQIRAGFKDVYYGRFDDEDTVVEKRYFAAFQMESMWLYAESIGISEESFTQLIASLTKMI